MIPWCSSVHGTLQARILSGLLFASPRDIPDQGIKPGSPALQADSLLSHWAGKPLVAFITYHTISFSKFYDYWLLSFNHSRMFSSVQLLSHVWLCNTMDSSMPGFPVHHQLPELTQTHVHQVGDAIQTTHLCSLLLLLSIFPSIRVFSNESVLSINLPNYWNFSFSISLFSEYSRLISFTIDWLDLLAVQETFKSPFQHHSSKASILLCSAFFRV